VSEIVAHAAEILKPLRSFIDWVIAVTGILLKIYEVIRAEREKPSPHISNEIRVIVEISYRCFRRRKVDRRSLLRDIEQINIVLIRLADKIRDRTGRSLFDVLKDPQQELPELPSDEVLKEVPILELVIKEEMKNIGNIAIRIQQQLKEEGSSEICGRMRGIGSPGAA